MRMLFVLLAFACAAAAASLGCSGGKSTSGSTQTKRIGGCEIETTAIGCGFGGADEAPADAAWMRVSSVDFAGNDVYRKAALGVRELIESRGVKVYSCTELRHVKEGPCWPPYSIEFKISLTESSGRRLFAFLQQNSLADCRPASERPENYGPFFVSCGTGASDWWTVWYRK
jgi:hypothetical protein